MKTNLLIVGLLLLPSCSKSGVNTQPGAIDHRDITMRKLDRDDGTGISVLYARNDGDMAVTLVELTLFNCRNMFEPCGDREVNVVLPPRRDVEVLRVQSSVMGQHPNFGYRFRWRGPGRKVTSPSTSASGDITVSGSDGIRQIKTMDATAWVPLVPAVWEGGECLQPLQSVAGDDSRVLQMRFGEDVRKMRMIAVRVTGSGEVISISDTRGDIRVPPPGMKPKNLIDDPGPRTSMTIDMRSNTAFLMNQPVGAPASQDAARGNDLIDLPNLDVGQALVDRVVRECGE